MISTAALTTMLSNTRFNYNFRLWFEEPLCTMPSYCWAELEHPNFRSWVRACSPWNDRDSWKAPGAWALKKSLTRPFFSLYFREIRNKRSHRPGGRSAPRLNNIYNLCPCARPAHVGECRPGQKTVYNSSNFATCNQFFLRKGLSFLDCSGWISRPDPSENSWTQTFDQYIFSHST